MDYKELLHKVLYLFSDNELCQLSTAIHAERIRRTQQRAPFEPDYDDVRALWQNPEAGKRIEAIKLFRARQQCDLLCAKTVLETKYGVGYREDSSGRE